MSVACLLAFPAVLPNLYHLRDQIFTSGQPTSMGHKQLRSMGIETVINVLPKQKCDPGEPTMVEVKQHDLFRPSF
jgi:hypothetical protein